MKFDYHTHHVRCGHAVGSIEDYIKEAIAGGLSIIGISDHSPYFAEVEEHARPGIAMAKSEFPRYIEELTRLKELYKGRIEVMIGVESDFFPLHAELYREIYRKYPLDYIIGSVHITNGSTIFNRKRWEALSEQDLLKEKEHYFDLIGQSARSGMFDILGHIDAIKKNYPEFAEIKSEAVETAIRTIAECDVAIELNTSGNIFECEEWFPSDEILQMACHYGVKVTFGSDAHKPGRIAEDWENVRRRLLQIGYKEWAVFRKRKREMVAM